jgi:hypothetical protein
MKQIENTTIELVQKYAEYRGHLDERITFDILLEVYKNADKSERAIYKREMKAYIEAVDSGKIEKGVPIVALELSS